MGKQTTRSETEPLHMTPWQKFLDRRMTGLGFVSRLQAWREPTEAEKAAALAIETKSWQEGKGKKVYSTTAEYSVPVYKSINDYGVTTKGHREDGDKHTYRKQSIKTYVETPIDIGKDTWLIMDWWTAIRHWFRGNKIKREEKRDEN